MILFDAINFYLLISTKKKKIVISNGVTSSELLYPDAYQAYNSPPLQISDLFFFFDIVS